MAQALTQLDIQTPIAIRHAENNVVPLRQDLLPRHREFLARWLEAGLCMGLCDADICEDGRNEVGSVIHHVLVWVRENADPAYMIRPRGMRWVLIDHLRDHEIGSYGSFETALNTIRPVLPAKAIVAA